MDAGAGWSALKDSFAELVELHTNARKARLDAIRAADPRLGSRLEALLAADADVETRLERFESITGAGSPKDVGPDGGPGEDLLGIAGTSIAHFHVRDVLGVGGMGIAYRAEDTRLGRTVALKFLLPHFARDADAKRRFLGEARAASALDHANVCTVLEVGESRVGPFLAMPAYAGETLRERLDRQGALTIDQAVDITCQVLRGLEAAHTAGITHRDLKAGNLIMTPGGVVKILDFGLADGHDAVSARPGTRAGTITCMSPEQLVGGPIGPGADLWALGVLLYEMLTGKRPFVGGIQLAAMYSILHDDPAPPSSIVSEIPPRLDAIVGKLLRKDPADRFASAESVLEALALENVPGAHANSRARSRTPTRTEVTVLIAISAIALAGLLLRLPMGAGTSRPPPSSVAVLPFVDASSTHDQAHLADGVAEEILNALIHVPGLRVPPRPSSFRFAGRDLPVNEIARQLDVDAVLEGTVQRDADRLRISTRLLDVRTGSYIWSRTFDGSFPELLDTQTEIATTVAAALQHRLSPAPRPTSDMVAYELYLRGLFHWNRRTVGDLHHAIDYFTDATERDPSFARAWAGLALAFAVLPPLDPASDSLLPRTHEAARRALALDPRLAAPHAANGYAYHWEWRWTDAEREFREAIALDSTFAPAYQWYGEHLAKMGRGDEGEALMRRAIVLDPLSLVAQNDLGIVLMANRRFDEAIAQFELVRRNEPGFALPALLLHRTNLVAHRPEAAAEAGRLWADMTGSADGSELATLALATADTSLRPQAREILVRWASRPAPPWAEIAMYSALIGDRDPAIAALDRAMHSRSPMLAQLRVAAWLDPLRDDPRVIELLRQMSFP